MRHIDNRSRVRFPAEVQPSFKIFKERVTLIRQTLLSFVSLNRTQAKLTRPDPDVKTYSVHFQPSYSPTEHRLEYLYQSKCSQQFDLTRSGSEVLLRMRKTEKVYQPHEFCVNFQSDGTLAAIVANRLEDQSEETNVTVKSELDEQFGCLQTSMVEVTARLTKLTDMREGIVFQFGDAEVALKQETNAYFEDQNAEMTERFEKLVQSYSQFLKSKFEEQALNMTQHAN